jgi:hypothetical protein
MRYVATTERPVNGDSDAGARLALGGQDGIADSLPTDATGQPHRPPMARLSVTLSHLRAKS